MTYKHSEATKQKMRENHTRCWLGKKFSPEHRRHISEGHKGLSMPLRRRPPTFSAEHRKHLSIAVTKWHKQQKKKHDKKVC